MRGGRLTSPNLRCNANEKNFKLKAHLKDLTKGLAESNLSPFNLFYVLKCDENCIRHFEKYTHIYEYFVSESSGKCFNFFSAFVSVSAFYLYFHSGKKITRIYSALHIL